MAVKTGFELIKASADSGYGDAQFKIAGFYHEGTHVPKNTQTSERYYMLGADSGNAWSMYFLAEYTERGEFNLNSKSKVIQLYTQSAKLGNPAAQASLGRLYGNGESVPKNYISAYMWLSIAASQDSLAKELAKDNLKIIEENMTAGDISLAQKKAQDCYSTNYTNC